MTREDWITAALVALRNEGVGGINVERLAKRMGVTKGSFYWHFADRRELLDAVIDSWAERMIEMVRDHAVRTEGAPKIRLLQLMESIASEDRCCHEAAVRIWAARDERAATAVRDVDASRVELVRGLFQEVGFSEEQADIRARLLMFYEHAEPQVYCAEPVEKRLHYARLGHGVLTEGAEQTAA